MVNSTSFDVKMQGNVLTKHNSHLFDHISCCRVRLELKSVDCWGHSTMIIFSNLMWQQHCQGKLQLSKQKAAVPFTAISLWRRCGATIAMAERESRWGDGRWDGNLSLHLFPPSHPLWLLPVENWPVQYIFNHSSSTGREGETINSKTTTELTQHMTVYLATACCWIHSIERWLCPPQQ